MAKSTIAFIRMPKMWQSHKICKSIVLAQETAISTRIQVLVIDLQIN